MDTISSIIKHIQSQTLPTPSSSSSVSKSTIDNQQPSPDITNASTGDINHLRGFSTALSEFLSRYDELRNHISFINSSIDSKLSGHATTTTSPSLSQLTNCNQSVAAFPVVNQIPKEGVNDYRRRDGIETANESESLSLSPTCSLSCDGIDASKKPEVVVTSDNREQIHNGKNYIGVRKRGGKWGAVIRKLGKRSTSKSIWLGTYSSPIAAARAYDTAVFYFRGPTARLNFPDLIGDDGYLGDLSTASIQKKAKEVGAKVEVLVNQNGGACDHQRQHGASTNSEEIDVFMKDVDIDTLKTEDIDIPKKLVEIYTWKNVEEVDVSNNREQIDTSKKAEVVDASNYPDEIDVCMLDVEIDTSKAEDIDIPKKPEEINASKNPKEGDVFTNLEEVDLSKNPKEVDVLNNPEEVDVSKNPKEVDVLNNPEEVDVSNNWEIGVSEDPEKVDASEKHEEINVSMKLEEVDVLKKHAETDTSKKPRETVAETFCAQTITTVPVAVILEQNPNGMATNCEQSHENMRMPESPEETDILKKPEQTVICKNPEDIGTSMNPIEIYTLKNLEETETVREHEETGILKKAEETDVSRMPKETENSKKSIVSLLEFLCENMYERMVRKHVTTHLNEMNKRHKEIAKALKMAEDPAKLVLDNIGRFFVRKSRSFYKDADAPQTLARRASILILECFVMISGDGIEISKTQKAYAEQAATDWRNRMINEGGLGQTDEIDARGLLLFISGFGIQDDVFKIQDIVDLIRASNVKAISTALRASVFLIPKIPEIIDFMVKNNLEIEAADIAYTFGLEDVCHPENILRTYLHNLVKDIQNGSSFQTLEAMKQHLFDLKSVQQCLESHNVDRSILFPHFKMNETIQSLERETNEGRLTQMWKSSENLIHSEVNHKNMQKPIGHAETDSSKKSEATVAETSCAQTITAVPEAVVSKQNPSRMTTIHKKTYEKVSVVDISKKPDTLKKPKETNICENPEEIETENIKNIISVLESKCRNMSCKKLKSHVIRHFSEMNNLHKEIAKALKLAADPAKLVVNSIGKFFVNSSRNVRKNSRPNVARLVSILILECFVMISSDGVEISKTEKDYAEQAATAWRSRMINEGGLGQTDEIDARGLLLFISGFGIRDDVFKIQDIVDLIRASNVKEISNALRGSVFLIPKIPEVIDFMVKNNLEIEAADIAYTFGLEDVCHPQNILETYLHNLVKDIQNSSSFQTLESMKQHLCALKSVKQCLESHNVDPSLLLPDFKINLRIQNLERETSEGRLTQKRKFLDNPIHTEANDESMQKPVGHAETDSSKKPEVTVAETSCAQTITAVSEAKNPSRMTNNHKQTPEKVGVVDISKKPDTLKKPKETNICENPEGTETENSKKSIISVLESRCRHMSFKKLKKHVTKHFSEMNTRHKEIAEALKLAADPAKLVLDSIGKFFVQSSGTIRKDAHQTVVRLALVLILECFVMISSDGIEIANTEKEYAAETAVAWRNRMIKEGGLGHTDEVDTRGLLLFISGFGIRDDVFKIQDIVDLIRASSVKGISTALRGSVFLIPKIPEVVDLMVKDNLQIEAVDIAYIFGLEDKCYPQNILRTYLHNLVKDIQDDCSLQTLEKRKQQLFNLKSVKQYLESHDVDPSVLPLDFKVNEMIEYLVREVNVERMMILKRKSLENPTHQEAKRACFNHKNMPHQQIPVVGHHGMSLYNRSTQPSTRYFNYSENIDGPVPNGPACGFPGSYDQLVHRADVPPYGWHGRNGQTYDSQPYGRQCERVPSVPLSYIPPSGGFPGRWGSHEQFPGYEEVPPSGGFPGRWALPGPYHGVQNYPPAGGFPRRRGPTADLYSFSDKV